MTTENIILNERSQVQKTTCDVTVFTGSVQDRQACRDGKSIRGPGAEGMGGRSDC